MIRVNLARDDNFELLLEVIGYERMVSLDMELELFLEDLEKGFFTKNEYRLAATQDMMAHLEIESESLNITLELHPRVSSVDECLAKILDAYLASKDEAGKVNPQVFSSKVSNQAAKGVDEWLRKHV
jgi:lipopolysaccharide biosynthesis glycosyltransferase